MTNCSTHRSLVEDFSEAFESGQVVLCIECGERLYHDSEKQALTFIDEIPDSEYLGG